MSRGAIVGLALLLALSLTQCAILPGNGAATHAGIAAGERLELHVPAPSIRDAGRSVRVYLPPSYSLPEARDRRYPVVVLLHGWPGGNGNWPGEGHADQTLDSLIAGHRIPEVIALFPDGAGLGFLGRSLWMNTWDGRSRMEDFLCSDLLTWADGRFRTRADAGHRAVIGLSDGATAGMNLVLKHPDLYGAVGGHSGTYRLLHDFSSRHLLGPDSVWKRTADTNSPLAYVDHVVANVKGQIIYFDCGSNDAESIGTNRELDAKLTALGVPHVFHEYPGDHGWAYWRAHLHESLVAVTAKMW